MREDFKLLPSIMCVNWLNAQFELSLIAPLVEYFHWDLVDGTFAPDFTMGSAIINTIREKYLHKGDYHLMIEDEFGISEANINKSKELAEACMAVGLENCELLKE